MEPNVRYPRDPERLLREVDATIRIKDIQEWQRLRERVEIQWWESALIALLFISGIGILVTIAMLIPREPAALYYFILAWCALWILTLITCVEFLIQKFRALRRMHEVTDRMLRRIEGDAEAVRVVLRKSGLLEPHPEEEAPRGGPGGNDDRTG